MRDEHLDTIPASELDEPKIVEIVINSNEDISSSDDDSLHEENIEYVEASPHDSELISLEAAKIVISEVEEIEDDNLRGKLLNVHLLIANIEALKDNPTPSSELLTKSSSTSLNFFLEETNTFHNSLPEFENFYFDLGEISSGKSKDLTSLSLDELIGNLKVHEMIIKKYSEIVKAKGEREFIALKAKKESSDEECLTSRSEDEEYAMAVRDFKKFFKRRYKNQRAFVKGSWSDSDEEDDEKVKASKELVRKSPKLKFDQQFCDACKIKKQAHTSHKAKNIVSTTRCLELLHMDLFGPSVVQSYEGNHYTLVIVDDYCRAVLGKTPYELLRGRKPTLDYFKVFGNDDLDEEEVIKFAKKKNLENDIEDETLEIDEIVNIKKYRNHPLQNVIEKLNQRTLRSQAQNQSNFFCFISTIEPKNVNEALTDESWIVSMQEELNQFITNNVWELVLQFKNMRIIGTKWVFRNKSDENGIVSINKARLFKNVVSIFPEFAIDHYISYDRVMHPLAPHYERKIRSDHGKKRPHDSNASSSSTILNHPSLFHLLDEIVDVNDEESFHSNSSSPS
nr:retrovirus-related Pol polyprotein from transposon TNT 1-94 [Tanacetum cinerariifolium]